MTFEFRMVGYVSLPLPMSEVIATARGFWCSSSCLIDNLIALDGSRQVPRCSRITHLTHEASTGLEPSGATVPDGLSPDGRAAGADGADGGNSWVMGGDEDAAARSVFADRPHQPLWVPSRWSRFTAHGSANDAAGSRRPSNPGSSFRQQRRGGKEPRRSGKLPVTNAFRKGLKSWRTETRSSSPAP